MKINKVVSFVKNNELPRGHEITLLVESVFSYEVCTLLCLSENDGWIYNVETKTCACLMLEFICLENFPGGRVNLPKDILTNGTDNDYLSVKGSRVIQYDQCPGIFSLRQR